MIFLMILMSAKRKKTFPEILFRLKFFVLSLSNSPEIKDLITKKFESIYLSFFVNALESSFLIFFFLNLAHL